MAAVAGLTPTSIHGGHVLPYVFTLGAVFIAWFVVLSAYTADEL